MHDVEAGGAALAPAAGPQPLARRLTGRALRHLIGAATETTHGIRFRSNAAAIDAGLPPYPGTLYDGAAGVALALLDVATLDRTGRAHRLGRDVVAGLVASTPPGPSDEPTGLYLGLTGTAVTVARWAIATDDDAGVAEALRVLALVSTSLPATSDVLGGVAGVGLGALALHRATGDARARDVVRACADRLAETARPHHGGTSWPLGEDAPDGSATAEDLQTGFAHGDAGVATFLVAAAAELGDTDISELRDATFHALGARMLRRGNAVSWPVSDRQHAGRHHWCHGTTGIAHAYVARYEVMGDRAALGIAAAAGEHTWHAIHVARGLPADRTTGHCHGLAGALELFTLLGAATGDACWSARAGAVVRAIARRAHGRGASSLDADGCGLAYGTAGVMLALAAASGAATPWMIWRHFPQQASARAPHEASAPAPASRTQRATRTAALPMDFALHDVVPTAAGALEGRGYSLPVGPQHRPAVARYAEHALGSEPGRELRKVLTHLEREAAALARQHQRWLASGALGEPLNGSLVRECAGLLFRPGNQPLADRRRVVRSLVERHVAGLRECLEHTAHDLGTHLAALGDGRITRVEHVGGDPHRGGAGVFGLTFEDGRRALHKPRSVRLDAFLAGAHRESAARRISERLAPPYGGAVVPQHDVIAAGEWHGYVERVSGSSTPIAECDPSLRFLHPSLGNPPAEEAARLAPGDEPRFWYSAGVLAGHAACFGMGDLHGENLVFGSSRAVPAPVLHAVDLEVAFISPGGVSQANLAPAFGHPVKVARDDHQHWGFQARHGGLCTMGAEEWCVLVTPDGVVPTRRPHQLAGRHAPNAVRNGDGSFGFSGQLCAMVRGFADYWLAVQPIHAALAQQARDELSGAAVRVLVNASRAYVSPRHLRMLGTPLWPGASWFGAYGTAYPLLPPERAQLDALDVPYFYQRLGTGGARWMDGPVEQVTDLVPHTTIADPFWSAMDAFRSHEALARGLADLVAFGAPEGVFDQRDDALGVRVCRVPGDDRLRVAVTTPAGALRFRLDHDGGVRWWES